MPCTITGTFEGDARLEASEANQDATRATQVACEALRLLKQRGLLHEVTDDSLAWFQYHEAVDRRRIEADREAIRRDNLRSAALAKLSPEERAALDL
jgi:hypothetical protein